MTPPAEMQLLQDALGVLARTASTTAVSGASHAANATAPMLASVCSAAEPSCLLQTVATCESGHCNNAITVLVFPFLALTIGCLLQPITRILRLPYTLLLMGTGIALGLLGCATDLGLLTRSLQQWVHLGPPDLFFYVFLAPLIFEASFNTCWHTFRRLLIPILTAAFPIVLAQTGLIAAFTRSVVGNDAGWSSWWPALMFGAMLSATDPISVTATLKALGASENLGTLIEGESLVNDGSAFVLWEAFFHNTRHAGDPEERFSPSGILVMVLKSSIGGALLGISFAAFVLLLLNFTYDEFEVETSLTIVVAFLGFWTAQSPAKLSGVIANVASGLTLSAYGRPLISNSVRHPLSELWELIAWIANTIVFVHGGVLAVAFVWPCSSHNMEVRDYMLVFAIFLFLQLIRVGLFIASYGIMQWRNKWFTWREVLVVGASGLRGSVSLILALNVAGATDIAESVRSRIVLWTTGIVILSLFVNGLGIPGLLHMLKLDTPNNTRKEFLRNARATTVQATLRALDILCTDQEYTGVRWSYVLDSVMPTHWMTEGIDGHNFAEAAEAIVGNATAHRASLDFVRDEVQRVSSHARHSNVFEGANALSSRRVSLVMPGVPHSATMESLRNSASRTPMLNTPRPLPLDAQVSSGALSTASLRPMMDEIHRRRSVEVDVERYRSSRAPAAAVDTAQFEEKVDLNPGEDAVDGDNKLGRDDKVAGQEGELTARDREVQRRVLTGMLAQSCALSNSTLIEYAALVRLEEDLQSALDANDEGDEYNLFAEIRRRSLADRVLSPLFDAPKFVGEYIVTATIMFVLLTDILKQDVLQQSPRIREELERVFDETMQWLIDLAHTSPNALCWVQSQFAIHVTVSKQDATLNDMCHSGMIDAFEHKMLTQELTDVRRWHFINARSMWTGQPLPAQQLLGFHPLFADRRGAGEDEGMSKPTTNLQPGQSLPTATSALVLVLQGAMRPAEEGGEHPEADARMAEVPLKQGPRKSSVTTTSTLKPSPYHWCFPAPTAFCTLDLACSVNNDTKGPQCPHDDTRTVVTPYIASSTCAETTVFSMTEHEVRKNAKESLNFRDEVTRCLARELVLQSVEDQKTYHLRMLNEALAGKLDEHTVIGRAFRLLERLPYMHVVKVHAPVQDRGTNHMPMPTVFRGPGLLVNGTVRVSTVDTSGLVGAVNLLHERLQGPALLPADGLIIEPVLEVGANAGEEQEVADEVRVETHLNGDVAIVVEEVRKRNDVGPVLAHVLIDDHRSIDESARARLHRWSAASNTVDMNGRFALFRQVTRSDTSNERCQCVGIDEHGDNRRHPRHPRGGRERLAFDMAS